mmetsp:Transcript_2037/g.5642  ORF Transcript_2037/g.5642 Transcript_2037/m.5642 type:complete len:455 (-) Transcript_2037:119-1483(-)
MQNSKARRQMAVLLVVALGACLAPFLLTRSQLLVVPSTAVSVYVARDGESGNGTYPTDSELKVYMDRRGDPAPEHAYSIFTTGAMQRYGGGSLRYGLRKSNLSRKKFQTEIGPKAEPPCLLISRELAAVEIRDQFAPHCRVMIAYDEFCKTFHQPGVDFRGFYSHVGGNGTAAANATGAGAVRSKPLYIPLGPRLDFWNAFQHHLSNRTVINANSNVKNGNSNSNDDGDDDSDDAHTRNNHDNDDRSNDNTNVDGMHIRSATGIVVPKSSHRNTIFNAVFSTTTSHTRKGLKELLINGSIPLDITERSFIHIAKYWTKELHKGHIQSNDYATKLLDSVFTLSPLGHNPESFRMFEAMEAGSIPIIALNGSYHRHRCILALHPMLDESLPYGPAPMIVLSDWNELPDTIQQLSQSLRDNPQDLDDRQAKLMTWYDAFMRDRAARFEDLMRIPVRA